jgi:hypothetical protein
MDRDDNEENKEAAVNLRINLIASSNALPLSPDNHHNT